MFDSQLSLAGKDKDKREAVAWKYSVKGVLRNFTKFTEKHLCQSPFFNKVAFIEMFPLLKKGLWHRCIPVNFMKFLKTCFLTEHLRWLLLIKVRS